MGPVLQQQKCVFRCSWMAHLIRSKSRTAVKFLLSSFLSVIIASQLTNYRSVVVVFSSSHTTGEACVCLAGCHSLTGSASQVHITPPGTTKHTGSEAGTVHFLNVLPRKFHKKEDTFYHWELQDHAQEKQNVPVYEILWEKFAIVNFLWMMYLEDYRWSDKLKTVLTLDWK